MNNLLCTEQKETIFSVVQMPFNHCSVETRGAHFISILIILVIFVM